ncbi:MULTISPECIES: SHOCT domain-containing protein [unclassified Sphaerochaeta]|uniref:SHOCT domain-containing protein n=1 Tax=unclassified Sphaerochaeta TaxID=2637943 RepID=UPI000A47AE6E|nr:SHOCT domain-containing protein [Sphaerochaeta sp. UBA5856]
MHALVWSTGRFAGPAYMYSDMRWLMVLALLAIVAALVLSIIAIVRTSKNKKQEDPSEALNIIGQRYAKGELTKEEYEAMKKDLK